MLHILTELNDLPDEILMLILKKLFNTEVLYSLIDVNKRLNTIVRDPIFTSHLTLMRRFLDNSNYPLPDLILDRFCSQILPSICHKIKWLNLESSSMKRILHATNYPNLYGLGLYDIEIETALSLIGISLHNQIYLQSKEDIQHTFRDFKDDQVISYVDYFQEQYGLCHTYLYPEQLKYYHTVTNNFPGGLFTCVRTISLHDEHPFEHEFFLRIAQSFPFMKKLSLNNSKPQNNKLCRESQDDNQDFSIINYPYLTTLTLYDAHDDYIEEFQVDTKICLPNNAV
ncbi:unnamed protein product, partial [Rotaria sordida]